MATIDKSPSRIILELGIVSVDYIFLDRNETTSSLDGLRDLTYRADLSLETPK